MSGRSPDFREFEQAGWQRAAAEYDQHFGQLTMQSVAPLLDSVGASPGLRLLDVACGPGYVTAAAARRGSTVIGIDFSSEMVGLASRLYPGLNFQFGDAENLNFEDRSFDAVVMNFGMLHLAQPEAAITEAFRVLNPGGKYAFTVWDIPERAMAFGIILESIQSNGNIDVPLPPGPPFFRFSDTEESKRTLAAAGFLNVQSLQIPQVWKLESGDALLETFRKAAVRTAALLNAQTPAALSRIRDDVVARAEKFRQGNSITLPMPAVLTSALKPKEM